MASCWRAMARRRVAHRAIRPAEPPLIAIALSQDERAVPLHDAQGEVFGVQARALFWFASHQ